MKIKKTLIILFGFYIFLIITDFNDILYAKMNSIKNDIKGVEDRLNLNDYKVNIEAKKVENIKDNLSGITYNKNTKTLFAITNSPRKISNLLENKNLNISFGEGLTTLNHFMTDFSGLHFDEKSRHLLFLSDESKSVAEVNLDGVQISFGNLEEDFLGLKKDIPQAEGVTMDEEGTLFIVSEPNLFYTFNKRI